MLDLLIWVLGIASIFMLTIVGYTHIQNLLCPEKTVTAVIDRKWTRDFDVDIPTPFAGASAFFTMIGRRLGTSQGPSLPLDDTFCTMGMTEVHLVSFRTSAGRIDLPVPEQTFIELSEGDRGKLIHKGETFRDFLKDAPAAKPVQTLPDWSQVATKPHSDGGDDAQS